VSTKQKILLSLALLVLFNFLLVIVFGDKGLVDYHLLKSERRQVLKTNEAVARENFALYREIDRLRNDLEYVENVARQDLGMIGKNELIFKFDTEPKPPPTSR
jgi:cell division protein FtsB